MPYLDLQQLPRELQAALQRTLPDDESRRRAVLAPWVAGQCTRILDQTWPWEPTRRFWRTRRAAWVCHAAEQFMRCTLDPSDERSPSIFSASQPYFRTDQTAAGQTLVSPWSDVFSDAEFWALTMQMYAGDATAAQNGLDHCAKALRAARNGRLGALKFNSHKVDAIKGLWLRNKANF
jgi:hypothetical protein